MRIYIFRHGETAYNVKGVMQGWLDMPLNENGRALAEATGRAMKGIKFDRCITSPLIRAKETAEIILKYSENSTPITVDDRLKEINFGRFEGKSLAEMGDAGRLFFSDPLRSGRFPGGESVEDLCARTQQLLRELTARGGDGTYLISTHGCAARAMVNFLYDDRYDFWRGHAPYNCSATVVDAENGAAVITETDKVFYDKSLITDHFRR